MTHAECVTGRRGVEPSDCPGRLELLSACPDRHGDPAGQPDRTVLLYGCVACQALVSVAHPHDLVRLAVGLDYTVLNVYRPDPARLVVALAEGLSLRNPARSGRPAAAAGVWG